MSVPHSEDSECVLQKEQLTSGDTQVNANEVWDFVNVCIGVLLPMYATVSTERPNQLH